MSRELPEFATDFLGNEIREGDTVVYPTGGSSCRMVRAVVRTIRDCRDQCYQVDADTYDRENKAWIKHTHKEWLSRAGHDGYRGALAFKIVVNRQQEGAHMAGDPDAGIWGVDDTKKVTLDQLHRVVSISALERKARSTHMIEVGDDMPYEFIARESVKAAAGELPPIENVPLWGDQGV